MTSSEFETEERMSAATAAPPQQSTSRDALKAILLILLFIITFFATITAFVLKRFVLRHRHESPLAHTVFSLVSCFGAGVFLATCLLHLLPEATESIEKAKDALKLDIDFPISELCFSFGFLLVLLIEQAIVYASERGWFGHEPLLDHHNHHHSNSSTTATPRTPLNVPNSNAVTANSQQSSPPRYEAIGGEGEEENDVHFNPESHSTMRALILVFALSLHAAFEGLSVGTIDQVATLLQIFVALVIHKAVVGFSLGVRLVQSKLRPFSIVLCCIVFSIQVLIGGFLAMLVSSIVHSQSVGATAMVSGVLQAIAAGTFLYVTAFEILPHELNESGNRPLKMMFLVLGFALIAGFIVILPDADDN